MIAQAKVSFLRISARKVRLVTDLIRGKPVEAALNTLAFTPKSASKPLSKLLRSAVANADQKGGVNLDKLYIASARVDEGPIIRRFMPRAMGRATRIRKRTCHVTLGLDQKS